MVMWISGPAATMTLCALGWLCWLVCHEPRRPTGSRLPPDEGDRPTTYWG
jgi:hypothetical protein